ncbi:PREDICTED: HMG box-containing protein 4 [Bactrocera latifrons]|uniref:HMG box-containing protein 4 n=1 Tax=Bactrocera latifrons TaxID=174628 RepID=UPI0008DD7438|nr:PREDICTED: HMG box-containing protein 4 [Bactrocera latifrons]
METPQNTTASKEFQVTGVSRSGRVRKKSSKLLDFQSPDEVEKKLKRAAKLPTRNGNVRGRNIMGGIGRPARRSHINVSNELGGDLSDLAEDDTELHDEMSDNGTDGENYGGNNSPTGDSDDDLKELVAGIVDGEPTDSNGNPESKVRSSLYMTEKANKRRVLKDGRVVTGKVERKDKGKTRYTAYSMWARELRKSGKLNKGHDLDFSNTAKRLGELWANVSNKEKDSWRRKAKIQATKAKSRDRVTSATAVNPSLAYFKPTTKAKNLIEGQEQTPPPIIAAQSNRTKPRGNSISVANNAGDSPTTGLTTKRRRNNSHNRGNGVNSNNLSTQLIATNNNSTTNNNYTSNAAGTTLTVNSHSRKSSLPNIEPVDTAAHLKLLGESLTIIGERLKEHEGQIAVSGSLSVLLDSLLCSLGPLLCLTTRIPGLERKPQLSENLTATLDNIAYVMPGL